MAAANPVAGRLRRPGWSDPRLLVGLALIAIAVVAVALVVRSADQTTDYYSVRDAVAPGTVLSADDLTVVAANVDSTAYVPVDSQDLVGQVVTRAVFPGELLAADAVVAASDYSARSVAVRASVPLADNLDVGSVVDVWVTTVSSEGEPSSQAAATGVQVESVDRDGGSFGVAGGHTVYVLVPGDAVGGLLEQLALDGEVAVLSHAGGS